MFWAVACHPPEGSDTAAVAQDDSADDSGDADDDARVRALAGLPAGTDACAVPVLGRVVHVVDGDTAWVQPEDGSAELNTRFIGVDTPEVAHDEPAECYGDVAAAFTESNLGGRLVWLTFDKDCLDPYDRTLAYVFRDDTDAGFFNRRLARGGYAYDLSIAPNDSFEDEIHADERAARDEGLGLWGACR